MLTSKQLDEFRTNGFVTGPRVLRDAEVSRLRGELKRVVRTTHEEDQRPLLLKRYEDADGITHWKVVNIRRASEAFRALISKPKIIESAANLLGTSAMRVWIDEVSYTESTETRETSWHQMTPGFPLDAAERVVSAWVALDTADEDNGCLSMVRGSYEWGDARTDLLDLSGFMDVPDSHGGKKVEVRLCPVPKGSVHFFHGFTWIGAHENLSNRLRRAVTIHFVPADARFDATKDHELAEVIDHTHGQPLDDEQFPVVFPQPNGR